MYDAVYDLKSRAQSNDIVSSDDKKLVANATRLIKVPEYWKASCVNTESTMHQLSPYVGKLKSVIARDLILEYSKQRDVVVDPFAGSGGVLFEAMSHGRFAFGADISPYAVLLSLAKTKAPKTEDAALKQGRKLLDLSKSLSKPDLRTVPSWVRSFFHPETLRECIRFSEACKMSKNAEFIFSCFLGILHHQRPGFLSYPSSHLVPYLRDKKYPKNKFPEMYEYRELEKRLFAKISRAYKRNKNLDRSLLIGVKHSPVEKVRLPKQFDCLITSPPYMNALDYGRDNRLRLWFISSDCAHEIDSSQSQTAEGFSEVIEELSKKIEKSLAVNGTAIFIVGESINRRYSAKVTDTVKWNISEFAPSLCLESVIVDEIPDIRRARRESHGVRSENFLIYRKRN